jgi:aminopeptidase N
VVPNSYGETVARIELDPFSYEAVSRGLAAVPDVLVRAVLWATMLDGVPPAPHLELLARQLPRESSPTVVAAALDRTLKDLVRRVLPPSDVAAAVEVVAAACAVEGEPATGCTAAGDLGAVTALAALPLTAEEMELVREALRGDVPTVLRRYWEVELDDRTAVALSGVNEPFRVSPGRVV